MLKMILRIMQPFYVLVSILAFSLGASLADYLGFVLQPLKLVIGVVCILLLQISSNLLVEYFRSPIEFSFGSENIMRTDQVRKALLWISTISMALSASLFIGLALDGELNILAMIIFISIGLFFLFYAVPPLRLVYSGFGEFLLAFTLLGLLPVFSFSLVAGEFHRFLSLICFPLVCLTFSYLVVRSFVDFASDTRYNRKTILVRIDWKRGVLLHVLLIIFTYLLLGTNYFLGMPGNLTWPALMTFPLGIWEIYMLLRIAAGGKAVWKPLITLSGSKLILAIYFISLTFFLQ